MQRVIAFAFLLSLAGFAGNASAATPEEQQAACQDDAFKFCNDAVPDEEKVKACLIENRRKLTTACRAILSGGRSRRK
jgi:hypothetical protein